MLLLGSRDTPFPLLLTRAAHAFLAWQLAAHWGNRRFARPSPRAEVVAAAFLLGSGSYDADLDPGLDLEGRPRSPDMLPVAELAETWRATVGRAAQCSRYAGLLIAAHVARRAETTTAELLAAGDTVGARSAQSLQAEMGRRQAAWGESLATDARYQQALDGRVLAANLSLLAAWEQAADHLCSGRSTPLALAVPGRSGEPVTVILHRVEERGFGLRPWPLGGPRLEVHCEGRRLPHPPFAEAAELRQALARAPVERISFTLQRPGARS